MLPENEKFELYIKEGEMKDGSGIETVIGRERERVCVCVSSIHV